MRTADLDYELPPELIAQSPVEPRDAARLLVVDRRSGTIDHRTFADLPALLDPSATIVVNTTRVREARLRGRRVTGGAVEVLLLEDRTDGTFEALLRPARRLRPGERVALDGGGEVEIVEQLNGGRATVRVRGDAIGVLPLPPYIRAPLTDPERYQTVYAVRTASAAAPTAGLHFTPALFDALRRRQPIESVELEIGLDTFRPVAVDDLDQHPMHSERYVVDAAARARIAASSSVVAIGTTVVRVLETIADPARPDAGRTDLKIQPGYTFRRVDRLVTNFHLPRSTLLALVMAFAGVELTRAVYAEAVRERYRFYSFGDAMLVR